MARIKKFEEQMNTWLDEEGIAWSYRDKKLPCAPTTRYPDYLFVTSSDHCVLLEVDEHEHQNYVAKCEIARISEILDSIDSSSLHVIRFNPNASGTTAQRRAAVIGALKDALASNLAQFNDTGCIVQYIGYTRDRTEELDKLACSMQAQAL
jgi:hypothetical protein